jgi:RNA polymerase sigma-70 factor (ECF subfamily)
MWADEGGRVLDAGLVARIARGDQAALAETYDRHAQTVFRAVMRMLGDSFAAEEVVQETWLVLWDRAERFDADRGSLIAWLLTIARNRSLDRLRAARRRPALVPVGGAEDDSPDPDALERALAADRASGSADGHDPEAATVLRWERSVVRAVVDGLPANERTVIELAYDAGLTQVEIAARLGWPLGTVKTRTRRALMLLRAALEEELGPGGDPARSDSSEVADPTKRRGGWRGPR